MDTLTIAILILSNQLIFEDQLYISSHYVYQKSIPKKEYLKEGLQPHFEIIDIENEKVHVVNSTKTMRCILPFQKKSTTGWSSGNQILVSRNIIEEDISFKGCNCVKIEEKYELSESFQKGGLGEVSDFSLLCTLPHLREIIDRPEKMSEYLHLYRPKLNGSHSKYKFELLKWPKPLPEDEETMTPIYQQEVQKIEKVKFPVEEVEDLLLVPEVDKTTFEANQ